MFNKNTGSEKKYVFLKMFTQNKVYSLRSNINYESGTFLGLLLLQKNDSETPSTRFEIQKASAGTRVLFLKKKHPAPQWRNSILAEELDWFSTKWKRLSFPFSLNLRWRIQFSLPSQIIVNRGKLFH